MEQTVKEIGILEFSVVFSVVDALPMAAFSLAA